MRRFEQIPEEFSKFAEKKEVKKEKTEAAKEEIPEPIAEEPTVEFKEMESEFSAEKALEKPGFFEFLNRRAPQPESLDKKEMETFYDAFSATKEIKNFYQDLARKEAGVKLEDSEIESLLEAHFVNNKDFLGYLREIITAARDFKELPERIAKKEQEFQLLGAERAVFLEREKYREGIRKMDSLDRAEKRLMDKKELSKEVRGLRGFFNWKNNEAIRFLLGAAELGSLAVEKGAEASRWSKLRGIGESFKKYGEKIRAIRGGLKSYEEEHAEAKLLAPAQWQKEISDTRKAYEEEKEKAQQAQGRREFLEIQKQELAALQERLESVRGLFFSEYFGPAQEIVAITKNKLREQLGTLLNPDKTDIKSLEAGLRFTAKLEKSDIEGFSKEEAAEFSEKFGELINQKVSKTIAEQLNKLSFRTFSELEKDLKKLFDPKFYGAKETEISRDFVRERLEEYIQSGLPEGETANTFQAKKIGIKCLLVKLGY